jgi:hypothetical protein
MAELSGKSPVEKFPAADKKSSSLLILTLTSGLQKKYLSMSTVCALFDLPKITKNKTRKQTLRYSTPFRPFLCKKIGQNAAADLSGRSTFYSAPFCCLVETLYCKALRSACFNEITFFSRLNDSIWFFCLQPMRKRAWMNTCVNQS